jgi:oxygen-independent coproporphyrinogen-3 oxidase
MGVSAISSIGKAYAQNLKDVPDYQGAAHSRGIATAKGYRLSDEDVLRRAVIGRLLCHTVLIKSEIENEFAICFDEHFAHELNALEAPQSEGLVSLERDEIRVTPLGRLFIRTLAMPFDVYLREQQMDARPLFSKTL